MTNHPELKACLTPFFINERIDEQETMLEIHEHIAHGSGKARRFVCEFDSSDRKLAEITLAALNTRPSPIIPEDAVTREMVIKVAIADFKNRMQTWVDKIICSKSIIEWEPKNQPALEHAIMSIGQSMLDKVMAYRCVTSSTSLEPVSDDGLREAIDAVKLAIEGFEDDIDIHGITIRHFKTLITHAIKGQSK